MALYPYKCQGCGHEEVVWQSISSYCESPKVPVCTPGVCEGPMVRVITLPMIKTDEIAPFMSTIDGEMITSKSQQREHMAKHGVVLFDDIAPEIEQKRRAREKAAVADIKDDIVASVHMLEAGHKPQVIPEAELVPTS